MPERAQSAGRLRSAPAVTHTLQRPQSAARLRELLGDDRRRDIEHSSRVVSRGHALSASLFNGLLLYQVRFNIKYQ